MTIRDVYILVNGIGRISASFLQVKSSKTWLDVADIARNLQIIPSYASNANCGAETLRFTSEYQVSKIGRV